MPPVMSGPRLLLVILIALAGGAWADPPSTPPSEGSQSPPNASTADAQATQSPPAAATSPGQPPVAPIEGPNPAPPPPVMKSLGHDRYQIGDILIDKRARRLTIPARVLQLGVPLEYLAVTHKGFKSYE